MTSPHHDLAAVMTVAVPEIVTTAAPTEVWDCVENYLRDQIDELKRQLAAERELPDA
jgi:hypothetical protein